MKFVLYEKVEERPGSRFPDGRYTLICQSGDHWFYKMRHIRDGQTIEYYESDSPGPDGLRRIITLAQEESASVVLLATNNFHQAHEIIKNFAGENFEVEIAEGPPLFPV